MTRDYVSIAELEASLPPAESLLRNPESYEQAQITRGDLAIAVIASACHAVKDNLTQERYDSLLKVVEVIGRTQPEVARTATHILGNLQRELLSR